MTAFVGSWTLRFRFQGKVSSIPNLIGPDTKYIQLKQLLTEKGNVCFGIDPNQLRFRGGFPPRVIQLSDNESISKNNLIRNKDMLHVELIDNNGNRIPVASPNGSNSSSGGSSNNNGGKRNNNNNKLKSPLLIANTTSSKPKQKLRHIEASGPIIINNNNNKTNLRNTNVLPSNIDKSVFDQLPKNIQEEILASSNSSRFGTSPKKNGMINISQRRKKKKKTESIKSYFVKRK